MAKLQRFVEQARCIAEHIKFAVNKCTLKKLQPSASFYGLPQKVHRRTQKGWLLVWSPLRIIARYATSITK
jgi:hypothetical protein